MSALLLFLLGWFFILVGSLLFLIAAFRVGILWGLACLFIPVVNPIFLIVHWHYARRPFLIQLCGLLLILSAFILDAAFFYQVQRQTIQMWHQTVPAPTHPAPPPRPEMHACQRQDGTLIYSNAPCLRGERDLSAGPDTGYPPARTSPPSI